MTARLAAVRCLERVIGQGESLTRALPQAQAQVAQAPDRALTQALCYGALRWHHRLSALLGELLEKPLRRRDLNVECVLRLGLYELIHLRTPAYATVNEWAGTARGLGKAWATRVINGVLRNYLRRAEELEARVDADPAARYSLPKWLLQRWRAAYPEDWEALAGASLQRPPMSLRVNLMKGDREAYGRELELAGLGYTTYESAPSALTLEAPVDVSQLPGFAQGRVSVQDVAAQLAATLLAAEPGMRVLDACAAPGGKTAHVLERAGGDLDLLAVDVDAERLQRVDENLQRLGLQAALAGADAAEPSTWWDGRQFDRILLDAPCSATGVIRRHPDIKLHRRPRDVASLQQQQARLLNALWPLLKPGGMLLYVTCSVLPEENANQLGQFLQTHADAREQKLISPWGRACEIGKQILTGDAGMDGFYYACLTKT